MTRLLNDESPGEAADADFVEIPGTAEDITEMEKTIDDELNSIFSEFGGDDRDVVFKIRVSRVIKDQGQEEICFYCMPQELPIFDRIKNEYGPGMYKITVFKNNLKFRNRSLNIAAQVKQPVINQSGNSAQELSAVLTAMAEMQQKNFEQMQSLLLNRPVQEMNNANPMQMLVDLAPVLTAFKSLFPPQQNNGTEMLLKGMEMMKDVNSDSGGEKGLYDMLITAAKEFGGPILEMSKIAAANPAVPAPQLPSNPVLPPGAVMVPTPTQPVSDSVTTQEKEEMGVLLNMQINGLVQKAASGADPALYADLIIDSMSEAQIREFIGRSDLKDFLISVNPQIESLWPWFESLQREVLAGLTPEQDLSDTPATETVAEAVADATPATPTGDITTDT